MFLLFPILKEHQITTKAIVANATMLLFPILKEHQITTKTIKPRSDA